MTVDLRETIDQLQVAHGAITRSREPDEARKRLRGAVDQARRILNNLPKTSWEGTLRHQARQLAGEIELAEGSLRGREGV